MKKITCSAIALACGLAASAAHAQTSVQIYGIVDSGIAHMTNVNAAGDSVTKMPSLTSSFPSRIGFRGTEDLGGGLQAFFVLENGFAMDVGTIGQGNRLFGRQAAVGLKGSWGALSLGRQLNMTYLAGLKTDVLGPHLFAIGSIDPYLPNARSDNSIAYMGNFNGFTIGATWSLGRDASAAGGPAATNCAGEVAGNARACRQYTGLFGYETKEWGLNTSYDRMYGNTGAAGGLTSSANTDIRTTVNGFVMLGATKIGGGVIDRETNAATGRTDSDLYYLGVSHPIGAVTIDAQVARRDTKDSSADVNMIVARVTYNFSKRTAVYGSAGRMDNKGNSAVALDAGGTVGAGMAQNGLMVGLRHTF
ncbi:porin [uncultured Massilia sp.]|uniref:porin n=1 Tax=uncultured Massilia sp. TaxID=169973 RepID=UPI0025F11958|nr:porin [uncultured Massilia sp.]